MAEQIRAVAYTRFSSDMQREESIEAQLRAIKDFAAKYGYALLQNYADRGISGTTDNRPEFQRMLDDAKKDLFDVVIVHKLDRFARNRADSAIYRKELSKNKVKLISVLENFDDSPESIILQSVIEGYNEYYSKNLKREVMKGLKENALSCRHTGGTPCLGYDVDRETLKLVINEYEANAVKLIFKRYLEGDGYKTIIQELNRQGFRTKRGQLFGKNSIYEILRNEKYTGVYIYNKSVEVDANGKFNRHAQKPEDEIIRIKDGIPQIISTEDFYLVQEKMKLRKKRTASFKARQDYLLSGKIVCGECGSTYAGNSRKARKNKPLYVSYNCTRKNGSLSCENPGLKKEEIERIVLERLAERVFHEAIFPEIAKQYHNYALMRNQEYHLIFDETKKKIAELDKGINNIVDVIVATGSAALSSRLKKMEEEKAGLEFLLREQEIKALQIKTEVQELRVAFTKAKQMLKNGTLQNKKAIAEQYVNKVRVFSDKIEMTFNVSASYTVTETVNR